MVLPTTTGDTVVLLTNKLNSLDGNGWEKWSDNSWNPYNLAYVTAPYQFGNEIAAVVCGGATVASYQSSLSTGCGNNFTVNFYDNSSNGVDSVKWFFQGGSPSTSTSATPVVTYSAGGTYTVKLVSYGAGGNDTTTGSVLVDNLVGTTTTTNASSANATDGSATVSGTSQSGSIGFVWNNANSDTTHVLTGLAAGSYEVTVFDGAGCAVVDTAVVSYTNSIVTLGTDKQVSIYPNPATETLNINFNAATTADIRISDMSGRVVASFNTENNAVNKFSVHELATGSYIITLTDKSTNVSQSVKFVKL